MRKVLLSAVAALALAGAATAQEDPGALYDAYNAAMAEGRIDDAVTAGMAAWRAAETAWGESRETAVLAYNIASLQVRLGRTAEAMEPAARALELAESGVAAGDVPEADAALVLGLAEFGRSGGSEGVARLLEALEDRGDQPADVDDLVALGWVSTALDARGRERWRQAAERAREAREAAARLGPDYASLVVDAATIEATSAVEDGEWADARAAYREALRAYPAAANPATDQRLAELMAWEFTTALVIKTEFELDRRTGTNLDPVDENRRFDQEGPIRRANSCYDWVEPRSQPVFPADVQHQLRYGSLLMAYDVTSSGALENVRVAAAAPANLDEAFIREVMEELPSWRATPHSGATDSCLRGQVSSFGFYFQ